MNRLLALIRLLWTRIRAVLKFLRRHLKATIATLVVLFIAWTVYAVTRPSVPTLVTAEVVQGDLRQLVEAVGTVVSEKDLELQFPVIDTVSQVLVKEGDKVKTGQRLAALRSGSLSASVASASASVQSAQAALQALEEGSRPEDIAIAEASLANRRASLDVAKQTLTNAQSGLVQAENELRALKSQADTALSSEVSTVASSISQRLTTCSTALVVVRGDFNANEVQDSVVKYSSGQYNDMLVALSSATSAVSAAQAKSVFDFQSALTALSDARMAALQTSTAVSQAYSLMSALPVTSYFTNASKETHKSTVATQSSNVQSALTALETALKTLQDNSASFTTQIAAKESTVSSLKGTRDRAKTDISTYETQVKISEAELALKRAPARQTDIDSARARVNQARAELARAAAQVRDTVLTAPTDGIVTKVNVKVGEVRPTDKPSITLLGNSPYRVEMFVSEIDIPKVFVGMSGAIVLDAFRGQLQPLRVGEIDQTPTDAEGVPKYRVKLDFMQPLNNLKVGMTGDAEVVTGFKSNVVSVPFRAIVEDASGRDIVRVLIPGSQNYAERQVTVGMEGEGGLTEVEGVSVGDTVVVLIKE
ncbi:MAG: efflux RND transporter periplasmic adaptor subunit [Candidatus Peribacteraceae bacterium]